MKVSNVNIDLYRPWPSSWVSKKMDGERKDHILCSIMYETETVKGKISIDGNLSWLCVLNSAVKLWSSKNQNRMNDKESSRRRGFVNTLDHLPP